MSEKMGSGRRGRAAWLLTPGGALLVALGAAACAGEPGPSSDESDTDDLKAKPGAVQMNDVSVLYPLAKSAADLAGGYLTPASKGVGGALLPAAVFDPVASQIHGLQAPATIDTLRAVAVRLDPCFAQTGPITDPASCRHQLRVVFQVLQSGTKKSAPVVAADSGFHAFYSLTPAQFSAALKEMIALRVASSTGSDLGPLTVHPLMAKQGLSGAMATGVNALVLRYAGAKNLTRLTGFQGVFSQHTSWNFAAVDVTHGAAKPSPIAGLAAGTLVDSVNLGTAPEHLLALGFAATTTQDDIAPLLMSTAQELTDDVRQRAFDSALRIENPDFHSPDTVDCASCHTAEIARQFVGQDFFKLSSAGNPNTFVADPKFVSKGDLAVKFPFKAPVGLSPNLHAFSYLDTSPMITQRVINETAAIVALLNSGAPTSK